MLRRFLKLFKKKKTNGIKFGSSTDTNLYRTPKPLATDEVLYKGPDGLWRRPNGEVMMVSDLERR